MDKLPQSQQRGITLDLGFSAFLAEVPAHWKDEEGNCEWDQVQFTLVDCPGHASLIRTIIGGAQIIDVMILVVDIVRGISSLSIWLVGLLFSLSCRFSHLLFLPVCHTGVQTQTAECIVIGEILSVCTFVFNFHVMFVISLDLTCKKNKCLCRRTDATLT